MNKKMRLLSLTATFCLLGLFNNCSGVKFSESASQGPVDGSFNAETGTPDPSTLPTPSTPPTPPAPTILPKISFSAPPCQRLSLCTATFKLDKGYSQATSFSWQTNDTLYMTPHTPLYAQPGVHYNSTSGTVTFAAGETTKTIAIQNINNLENEVIIGVRMTNCMYGTISATCASLFQ